MTPSPALPTRLEARLNQWGRLPVSASNSPAMSGSIDFATGARHHARDAPRPRTGNATGNVVWRDVSRRRAPREKASGKPAGEGKSEERSPANCPAVRYGAAVGCVAGRGVAPCDNAVNGDGNTPSATRGAAGPAGDGSGGGLSHGYAVARLSPAPAQTWQ